MNAVDASEHYDTSASGASKCHEFLDDVFPRPIQYLLIRLLQMMQSLPHLSLPS